MVAASSLGYHRDDCCNPVCGQSDPDLYQQKALEQLAVILVEFLHSQKVGPGLSIFIPHFVTKVIVSTRWHAYRFFRSKHERTY